MRFLIPRFDTGLLYEAGPIMLMIFFIVMVLRVLSRAQSGHYEAMSRFPLNDESTSDERRA